MARNPDRPDAVPSHDEQAWLRVTRACIGDAVITTDSSGKFTLLNTVAQSLTGWTHEETRQPVESPTVRAVRESVVVRFSDHTLLVAKDGSERAIDHSIIATLRTPFAILDKNLRVQTANPMSD